MRDHPCKIKGTTTISALPQGNGVYVAVGNGVVLVSPDAIDWSP